MKITVRFYKNNTAAITNIELIKIETDHETFEIDESCTGGLWITSKADGKKKPLVVSSTPDCAGVEVFK